MLLPGVPLWQLGVKLLLRILMMSVMMMMMMIFVIPSKFSLGITVFSDFEDPFDRK